MNPLPIDEKDRRDAIQNAYDSLSQKEKIELDFVLNLLIAQVKLRNHKVAFGKLQALELIAMSGIWINKFGFRR